ncbi:MAG: helix-turn-helix transcriptional regulator [Solirubrobacteraceae bacterium]
MQQVQNNQVGAVRTGSGRPHVDVSEIPELNGMDGSERDLLFATDVASRVHMTPAWIYAQTRAGRIPHVKLGRYVRYRREAIDAWLAEIERGPSGAPW